MQIKILNVSEINKYIKRLLINDPILSNINVKGEVSNFKFHNSGHIYFTLKDDNGKIDCIMFRSNVENLKISIKNGMNIIVRGYISLYERDGIYQLYVDRVEADGVGDLYRDFLRLKEKLEAKGLFNTETKKQLPFIPENIAVITSPTGSAVRDIISVVKRRFHKVQINIVPVLVQGEHAAESIVKAIELCNIFLDIDVIIVARGGGSIEELWAFNEEIVANAIYSSQIPIISAVGHETDFTIADFVADLRAPTPSVAGELVLPTLDNIMDTLNTSFKRLMYAINIKISEQNQITKTIKNNYFFKYPLNHIYDKKQNLDTIYRKLLKNISEKFFLEKSKLNNQILLLNSLNPISILHRGYALVMDTENNMIKSIDGLRKDDIIQLTLADGSLKTQIIEIIQEDEDFGKYKF